jgi:hypothetical protein
MSWTQRTSLSSVVATSAVVLVLRSAVLLDSSLGLFTPEKPRPINLVGLSQMFGQDVKDAGEVNPTQQSTLCPIINKTLFKAVVPSAIEQQSNTILYCDRQEQLQEYFNYSKTGATAAIKIKGTFSNFHKRINFF